MYRMATVVNKYCTVYLKVAKKVNFQSNHKKYVFFLAMCGDRPPTRLMMARH